jgi:hypothetical protein
VKLNDQPFQWLKVYEEFSANHLEETNQAGPTTVGSTDGITIPANNPFNPFGVPLTPSGWRVLEYGPLQGSATVDTYRTLTGISLVNLPKNWFVDASFLYAESDGDSKILNAVSTSGLNAALSGTLPGFAGQFYNPLNSRNSHRKLQSRGTTRTESESWAKMLSRRRRRPPARGGGDGSPRRNSPSESITSATS